MLWVSPKRVALAPVTGFGFNSTPRLDNFACSRGGRVVHLMLRHSHADLGELLPLQVSAQPGYCFRSHRSKHRVMPVQHAG
jgi:hypothetical protein